jgi:NADH-quinone oxidoreductase subunit I
MKKYFTELFIGIKSLLVGMGVTIKAFFSPVATVQYPREKNIIPDAYRGHVVLVLNEKTGEPKCIACGNCERSCPSSCIKIMSEKKEGEKKKTLTSFSLDFTKCSLCGICVESCPLGAIEYSNEYNLSGFTKEEFHYDLLKCLKETSC